MHSEDLIDKIIDVLNTTVEDIEDDENSIVDLATSIRVYKERFIKFNSNTPTGIALGCVRDGVSLGTDINILINSVKEQLNVLEDDPGKLELHW